MAYEVHLKEFDGPLDLLLHLIEQAKVDIKDIFISEITNQYLSLMEELDELEKKINKEKKENSWFDLFAKKVTNLSDEILKDN